VTSQDDPERPQPPEPARLDYATPTSDAQPRWFKLKTSKLEVGVVLLILAVLITLAKYYGRMD
jgi:hypothetical protein